MTNIIGKKFIFVRHAEVISDGRFMVQEILKLIHRMKRKLQRP